MFSDNAGEAGHLWAIDNDIRLTDSTVTTAVQTSNFVQALLDNKKDYISNFRSVVSEILDKKHERYVFRQINHLIFDEIPEFFGILPASLNTLWSLSCNEPDIVFQYDKEKYPLVDSAIDSLLQMIRQRYLTAPFNVVYEKLLIPNITSHHVKFQLCKWCKHPGDEVAAGDLIVVLQVEKVESPIEIRAQKSGKIVKTLAQSGMEV